MRKDARLKSKNMFRTRTALILLGVALSFILLECGLRGYGAVFSYLQAYHNKAAAKRGSVYKILCLGESTTARQYPEPLEEALNMAKTGREFKVIDKGIIGTNTSGIMTQLEKYLDDYRPDMVIAMMGYNDRWIMYYNDVPEAGGWLFRNCRVYRFFRLMYSYVAKKLKNKDIYVLGHHSAAQPHNAPEYAGLGKSLLKQGDLINAERAYKKAVEINPFSDEAYAGLGRIYFIQGKWGDAEEAYKTATGFNPRNDTAWSQMGEMFRNQMKMAEAERCLRKAIGINPGNQAAYTELGCVYRHLGDLPSAAKYFRWAMELMPDDEWACYELVQVYKRQGDFEEAEAALKRYLENKPSSDWGYRILGSLYKETGRDGSAQACSDKLKELNKREYPPVTIHNYNRLKRILDKRGVRLVCAQYPMRGVESLKEIFEDSNGIIFVDNQEVFQKAVQADGYREYFMDMFAGDFGHCTKKGNRLLAENIARAVLKEVFYQDAVF